MPLGLFTIEEREKDSWFGEVEISFPVCRRFDVRGNSIEEVLDAVRVGYRELLPLPDDAPEAAESERRYPNLERARAARAARRGTQDDMA